MKSNVGIRRVHTISSSGFSIYKRLKIWTLKKINPRLAKRDPNAIVKDMNVLISLLSPEHSKHWSQLCCPDVGTNEFFREEDINEYVSLKFEGRDFFAWKGYEEQGIKNGAPSNKMKGPAFKTDLATAYPDCRLVVTKETMTVEGMIKIVYDLLKDKLNIAKLTFTSGVNAASQEFEVKTQKDRCPLCGVELDENGVCPKCGYKKH